MDEQAAAGPLAASDETPAKPTSGQRRRVQGRTSEPVVWALRAALFIGTMIAWQLLTDWRIVSPFYISSPLRVGRQFFEWVADGTIADNATTTLTEAILGWIIGSVLGCLAGFTLGRWNLLQRVLEPFILSLTAIPRLAMAPLFIIWFGLGIESKVALIVTVVFFVLLINTYAGTKSIDADLQLLSRALGSSRWQITRYIEVPTCLPWIFAGLRLALAYSVAGAIVGEFVASERGLGNLIQRRGSLLDVSGQFAALVTLLIMVWIIDIVMTLVERRLFRWRPSGAMHAGS
jgi:NitT/TauT family transport system permease protein